MIPLLTLQSPSALQPPNSIIPLWEHQKKMLQRCISIEQQCRNLQGDTPQTFGIMGDKPGTGKTNVAISLILSDLKSANNQCNLIVVPQNIYSQWDQSIRSFCDLTKVRYHGCVDYSEISKLYSDPTVLQSVDILLTTSLYYHTICGTINTLNKTTGLTIGRVFFDEIDTLSSMLREPVQSQFTWFISASFKVDKMGCYKVDHIPIRLCKCEDALIDASFDLKPPIETVYPCHSIFTEMLKDIMPTKKISELNALDFNTNIYRFVTVVPKNEKEFVFYLLRDLDEILTYSSSNIQNLLKAKKEMEESGFFSGQLLQTKVQSMITQIQESQQLITASKNIKKRIYERLAAHKICSITLSDVEQDTPLVSKCCKLYYYPPTIEKIKKLTCPLCEAILQHPISFLLDSKKITKVAQNVPKHKFAVFTDMMEKMKESSKIIIFSDFPCVFKTIEGYLKSKQIKYVSLDGGSIPEIDKAVQAYKNSDSRVLLADSSMYGCGMNFENTTDVVFIHKMNSDMEKQIIGRAQRPGRKGVLQIHRLKHPNEQ